MKKAFTIAEILMTLGIIGVLASITLGMLSKTNPNSDALMFRKAYNTTTNAIYSILQSGAYYEDGVLSDTSEAMNNGVSVSGDTKFCQAFAEVVNTLGAPNCNGTSLWNAPTFYTSDGVAWYLPINNFQAFTFISVDINGAGSPNCLAGSNNCPFPDRFQITVTPAGKVRVDNATAQSYLTNRRNIVK